MKAINYNMKKRIGSFVLPWKPLSPSILQNMSYFYKKKVKNDQNQKLIYFFFVKNPCRSQ